MVRRNNKKLIINMIGILVIGLITLMIVMFMVISTYVKDANKGDYVQVEEQVEESAPKVEYSATLLILVEKITDTDIVGFDIEKKEELSRKLTEGTRINDSYGSAIPSSQIKPGDIIEMVYQEDKAKVLSISKTTRAKSWKRISGVTVDESNKQINIGGTTYHYVEDTRVFESDGNTSNMALVTPFDVVSIQGVNDVIWSINIDEVAGGITIKDLPTTKGSLEIDRSRFFSLEEINETISIVPGEHKILIQMEGYEIVTQAITVNPGQNYEISLKDVKEAYTVINPLVNSGVTNYTIQIEDKVYKPGEEIKVQQGTYTVKAEAEGYESWSKEIECTNKETYNLYISLVQKPQPTATPTSEENNTVLNNTKTITLNTNPIGAKAYVNGVYKGQTPCTVTLINGTYGIIFEKEGYAAYSTNVILDGSGDQVSYLYDLIAN